MKIHRLSGQNLLRHNLIQEKLTASVILLSDSAPLQTLIYAFFFWRCKFVLHTLELYSISFAACISEYKNRWSKINLMSFVGLKSIFGFILLSFKAFLMIRLAFRADFVIVSSTKRAEFLINNGANYKIRVLRNKPVYDSIIYSAGVKDDIIVLIGNMYHQYDDFLIVHSFAYRNNYQLRCYGLTDEDRDWVAKMNLSNVVICERLDQAGVAAILKIARYSLCFYSNATVNSLLSASSKVFEILYFKVIPIVSNNEGLICELDLMAAPYVLVENLDFCTVHDLNMFDGFETEELLFSNELSTLSN